MFARVLVLLLLMGALCSAEVIFSEETLVLPTYETKDPEKVPLFFRSEEVQLAERHIYPYPFYDVQDTQKVDKAYRALFLEVGDLEPGSHVALLKTLDVNGEPSDTMGFDTPQICPGEKIRHNKCLVLRNTCFLVGFLNH